ncbi:chemotaxis protein CheB (plasmid) [Ensifer sp. PDNC004]|uniref:chemotaxis protein CheB n=1 Tax=unclassified Ensifer TaxID=2633371 RepID=UPI0005BA600F|nr:MULTISPECIES: chemotaxis protein CheB [unclassified Ensifer]QRY70733.1 chemotaxis protein CheB [Ensifer sp. PDNC004]
MTPAKAQAVIIGASAGAVEALSAILPALPRSFALPVIVVVHIPSDRPSLMVDLFRAKCLLPVEEAEDKQSLEAGTIYFAPPDYHLLVETDGNLSLSSDEPVLFSRPSIDILFESAADAFGPALVAIVLTGANRDGADGLAAVHEAGGTAIVQNPEGAHARAMPEAAIQSCPSALILTLDAIAEYLKEV